MSLRLFIGLLVFLLASLLLETPAQAQQAPEISLHAFSGRSFLGHGGHPGSYQGAMLLRQFHPLGYLGLSAGTVSSSDLRLRPDEAESWRHRQLGLVEGIVHFDVVRVRVGESIANRFSFRMGLSYQFGHEETSFDVQGPDETHAPRTLPEFLIDESSLYVYNVGGKVYNLRTVERSSTAIGTLMSLEYSVSAGPVVLGLEGSYRYYRSGTPLLTYGVSLGVRY